MIAAQRVSQRLRVIGQHQEMLGFHLQPVASNSLRSGLSKLQLPRQLTSTSYLYPFQSSWRCYTPNRRCPALLNESNRAISSTRAAASSRLLPSPTRKLRPASLISIPTSSQ